MNSQSTPSARLVSIDALRGFDMLMIAGLGQFIAQFKGKTNLGWLEIVARQFIHPDWYGFAFYDFIFPLFLFLAGVSIPFSIAKALERGATPRQLYRKAFVRMLILIVLGMLDKNSPFPVFEPLNIRLGSVLGRIGLAGFVSVVLFLNFDWRKRLAIVAAILLAYYTALFLIPVPGYGAGDLSMAGNLVGWIDRTFLPGRLHQKTYDELGILTQFPSLCLTMLGVMAGEIMRDQRRDAAGRAGWLLLLGAIGVELGLIWSLHFPISKHLWTSSFILLTGGLSFITMGVFYAVIDVLNWRGWAFPLVVVGMNSLTIYLAYRFINFPYTAKTLFSGLYKPMDAKWQGVMESAGALLIVWFFLYYLYRKKIFFKV